MVGQKAAYWAAPSVEKLAVQLAEQLAAQKDTHLAAPLVDRKADYLVAYWAVQTVVLKADYWADQKEESTVDL